jgi:hypothetical protein
MESLQLNLLILLWALCWNNSYPDLISNNKARFARTGLTMSELLPGILRLWHHPPRAHNRGIRTKAACRAMEDWVLNTVLSWYSSVFEESLSPAVAPVGVVILKLDTYFASLQSTGKGPCLAPFAKLSYTGVCSLHHSLVIT